MLEVTTRTAAYVLEIHHHSAALFYHKIRLVIEYHWNLEACELFDGEVQWDESYFSGIRKGKHGRGAGKVAVFGLLKRNGRFMLPVLKILKLRHYYLLLPVKSNLIA